MGFRAKCRWHLTRGSPFLFQQRHWQITFCLYNCSMTQKNTNDSCWNSVHAIQCHSQCYEIITWVPRFLRDFLFCFLHVHLVTTACFSVFVPLWGRQRGQSYYAMIYMRRIIQEIKFPNSAQASTCTRSPHMNLLHRTQWSDDASQK